MINAMSTRWLANPNQGHSHVPITIETRMDIKLMFKSVESRARQMVISVPPSFVHYRA
jgi:hypothetical protein